MRAVINTSDVNNSIVTIFLYQSSSHNIVGGHDGSVMSNISTFREVTRLAYSARSVFLSPVARHLQLFVMAVIL